MMNLLSLPGRILMGVGFLALMFSIGYYKGHQSGKVEQLQATVAAEKKRKVINNETGNLDDYALCIRLGGLPDDCLELRRMDASSGNK